MSRKSSDMRKHASAGKPNSKVQARQVTEHRRGHAAVHRFVGQLEREVEDAIDAARARQLAPIKGILQNWRYLWRRYLDPAMAVGEPRAYPKPPAGWVEIEPDLAIGLKFLDTKEWNACFDDLKKVTAALEVYEGRPFRRKLPWLAQEDASDDETVTPAQSHESDSEDRLLNKLQQDARKIAAFFNSLKDSLAGPKVAAVQESSEAPKPNAPTREMIRAFELHTRDGLTQHEAAERLTVEFHKPFSQGKISRWIKKVREYYRLPTPKRGFSAKSYNPAKLALGERKDHRTPRQRKPPSGDDDEQ
jgi:hypothetical protein